MRLPDFGRAVSFVRLRRAMGIETIPELPAVVFQRTVIRERVVEEPDPIAARWNEVGPQGVVEVDDTTLKHADGLLEVGGRKVVAYIRDQRQGVDWAAGVTQYRYHLAFCSTLVGMRESNREHRYLATQRTDGKFEVRTNSNWGNHERKGEMRMELCANCRHELGTRGRWFEPFNLGEYLKRYDTGVPSTIRRVEQVPETQTYQPNQQELAERYKQVCGYRCQVCKVVCRSGDGLLHLHHRNGDTSNNQRHNLAVLCIECHAREPLHVHMTRVPSYPGNVARIRQLRSEQGIPNI